MTSTPTPQLATNGLKPWGTYEPSRLVQVLRGISSRQAPSYLGKRVAFACRKLAMAFMSGPADVEIFGQRMRIEPFANLAEKRMLFTPQYFDAEERELLALILPVDAVFVDIGANVGAYSFFAASLVGPSAKILAIEPQPGIYQRLVANIGFNPGIPVEPIEIAIADKPGPIELFLDRTNAGEASVRRVGGDGAHGDSITVDGQPLDTVLAARDLTRIDAMKIDVEGAEDLILVPFFESIDPSLWPVMLIIENSPESWQTDCVELALERGYSLVRRTRLNIVMTRSPSV